MSLCTRIHRNPDGKEVGIQADVTAKIGKRVDIPDGTGVELYFSAAVGGGANIGPSVKVLGNASVGNGATLCDGVEVGWSARIGQGAYLGPRVKLGQRSSVGAGVIVPADTTVPVDRHIYHQADADLLNRGVVPAPV